MTHSGWIAILVFVADLLLRLGLSIRVIMRRLPVGVALAWLVLILVFPFVGSLLYLLLGEYRLGLRRTRRAERDPGRSDVGEVSRYATLAQDRRLGPTSARSPHFSPGPERSMAW